MDNEPVSNDQNVMVLGSGCYRFSSGLSGQAHELRQREQLGVHLDLLEVVSEARKGHFDEILRISWLVITARFNLKESRDKIESRSSFRTSKRRNLVKVEYPEEAPCTKSLGLMQRNGGICSFSRMTEPSTHSSHFLRSKDTEKENIIGKR